MELAIGPDLSYSAAHRVLPHYLPSDDGRYAAFGSNCKDLQDGLPACEA